MGGELLSSKVVVVEEPPRVRGIATGPTSVSGAVGVTERGPIGIATLCTSFDEYEEVFGGFIPGSDLPLAVAGFFENGGSTLWVVRTCHHDDVTDAASATAVRAHTSLVAPGAPTPAVVLGSQLTPLALRDGAQLVLRVGTSDINVVISARPARLESSGAAPFALTDGATLELVVDGAHQSITLRAGDFVDVTAATALELAAVMNAQLVGARAGVDSGRVFIETDSRGRAASLEVVGGTALVALGLSAGAARGAGNVERAGAVAINELIPLLAGWSDVSVGAAPDGSLRIATTATGASASITVLPGTDAAFGLTVGEQRGSDAGATSIATVAARDAGAFGNRLRVDVLPPSSAAAGRFDLAVNDGSTPRELFRNLSLDRASPSFVEKIVNASSSGSAWITVSVGASSTSLPVQRAPLAGGSDGAPLADVDYVGDAGAGTGLHALDRVLDLSLLFVPGVATPTVHGAMLQYCEVERGGFVFAILDPPPSLRATQIVDYVATAALEGLSELGAIYWPRLRVPNPQRSVFGASTDVVVAPSGILAGVYARTDAARPGGVYDAPAGIELGKLLNVLGFETDEVLEERKRDLIYPHRINPLTTGPTLPRFVDGARTLKGDGQFPFVSSRRGVSSIERALKRGLEFVRHRNPTESLLAEVDRTVRTYLLEQTGLDAFQSRDPDKAFFVETSSKLISVAGGVASRVLVRVGLAMNAPAEFVVISVSQDTRAIEAALGTT